MNTYSDEDQIEILKKWWSENGVSTIVSIFLAISAVLGWQYFKDSNIEKESKASFAYQELIGAVFDIESNTDDIKIARAIFMAENIKSDFSKSAYGHFSALLKARQAVEDDDLTLAEKELKWILSKKPVDQIRFITELRLAKVLFSQGQYDKAIEILNVESRHSFSHAFLELKGDILISLENYPDAIDAYHESIEISNDMGFSLSKLLDIKLAHAKTFL